jgi:hypothetical protein
MLVRRAIPVSANLLQVAILRVTGTVGLLYYEYLVSLVSSLKLGFLATGIQPASNLSDRRASLLNQSSTLLRRRYGSVPPSKKQSPTLLNDRDELALSCWDLCLLELPGKLRSFLS